MSGDAPLDSGALTDALNRVKESQDVAPATMDPDENEINQVTDMGFSRDEAIRALKQSSNNVARAIEYIFNGTLETSDEPELLGIRYKEDEDMARAMAASQAITTSNNNSNTTHSEIAQVSGYYDTEFNENSAQIVPYTEDSNDYNSHTYGSISLGSAEPTLRLKDPEEPSLLVPSRDAPYIAPLLVILHSIPLARRALLNDCEQLMKDYGYNPNWWNGTFIDLEKQFSDVGLDPASSENSLQRFLVEAQRIMAFLDGGSQRPFADLSNLLLWGAPKDLRLRLKNDSVSDIETPIGEFCKAFFQRWPDDSEFFRAFNTKVKLFDDDEEQQQTGDLDTDMHSVTFENVENVENVEPTSESNETVQPNRNIDGSPGTQKFCNLVCDVMPAIVSDLYEVVDDMIWPPPTTPKTYLYDISDIVSLTLKRDDGKSGSGINIPVTWYPDRYSQPIVKYLTRIKLKCDSLTTEAQKLGQRRNQCTTISGYDGYKLFDVVTGHLQTRVEDPSDNKITNALADLTNIRDKFLARKETLERELKEIQTSKSELRSFFQGSIPEALWQKHFPGETKPEMRPYRLAGVILSPTEYFVYDIASKINPPSLIDLGDGAEEEDPVTKGTWWKVSPGRYNEPVALQVEEEDVLRMVKEGSSFYNWQEVTVFYADSNAMDTKKHWIPLSSGLQEFVAADAESLKEALRDSSDSDENADAS